MIAWILDQVKERSNWIGLFLSLTLSGGLSRRRSEDKELVITADLIWPDKAACERPCTPATYRSSHLAWSHWARLPARAESHLQTICANKNNYHRDLDAEPQHRQQHQSGSGWLTNVHRKQLPFATAGALTDVGFDVLKYVIEKTFPRDFDLKNKRFAAAALRVKKANKRKLRAAVYDRLGREYLETEARGGIKKSIDSRNIAIPTQHIKRTASGKVGAAKRPRAVLSKPNTFIRRTSRGGQILQKWRRRGALLKMLY